MFAKRCPYCKGVSYSAGERGTWICPYCQQDITAVPAELAAAEKQS